MSRLIKLLFFLLLLGVVFGAGFFLFGDSIRPAKAGSEHNLSGWAWSANVGWISFNSTNTDASVDYGVNVESDGTLTGFGWSSNIGWIKFNPDISDAPDMAGPAKLDMTNGQVVGWVRACSGAPDPGNCSGNGANFKSGGWDGWIKLRGVPSSGGAYGVSQSGCDFSGYAWGDDVNGWVRFRGPDEIDSEYSVKTTDANLCSNAPSLLKVEWLTCTSVRLSWEGNSPGLTRFELERDTDASFNSPAIIIKDVSSGVGEFFVSDFPVSASTKYYYRVRALIGGGGGTPTNYTNLPSVETPACGALVYIRAENASTTDPTKIWDVADIYGNGKLTVEKGNSVEVSWCGIKPRPDDPEGTEECLSTDPGATCIVQETYANSFSNNQKQGLTQPDTTSGYRYTYSLKCTASGGAVSDDSVSVMVRLNPYWRED